MSLLTINYKYKIGIIIPFYNGHQYLDKLLRSINEASAGFVCVVLIIDNSSHKKKINIPEGLNLQIEVIKEKESIGYGKACNSGFELCRQKNIDYIIIANQDGYFSHKMIKSLVYPFTIDNNIQITAPLLLKYGGNEIEAFFVQYYLAQVPNMISDLLMGNLKSFYNIKKVSGACFAFNLRNKLYRYNYLFDPLFHMYFEDEDLCRRVHMIGSKIVIVSQDAIFYHLHSHTTDDENKKEIATNRMYSEKVLSLKDPSKSVLTILYSIFVNVCHLIVYFFLKGQIKKCFFQIRSVCMMFLNLPAIISARKKDILVSRDIV